MFVDARQCRWDHFGSCGRRRSRLAIYRASAIDPILGDDLSAQTVMQNEDTTLGRIWSSIGAVASVALGFLLVIVLLVIQISLDIMWTVAICGIVGGLVGVGLGNRKLGGR